MVPSCSAARTARQRCAVNGSARAPGLTEPPLNQYRKLCRWKPLSFSDLPKWLQDNEYLLDGHRPELPNFRVCLESIFRVHTETGNIWTHMIGCFLFACIGVYFTVQPAIRNFQLRDKFIFGCFYAGAVTCLGCSFLFHAVSCHSQNVCRLFSKLDYSGISFLITFSATSWIYYCFYCKLHLQIAYITTMCVMGLSTIYVSMSEQFSTPNWRPARAALFICFGMASVFPGLHYAFVDGWTKMTLQSLGWTSLMGLLYVSGALLYAFRIPERFNPGRFDVLLHSHQIFHVFVVLAALVHFHGLSRLAEHRLIQSQC